MQDALPWVGLGVVACLVGIAAYFSKLSYTIFLVVVGLLLSIFKPFDIALSKEMILFVFLPPLLFEGSLHMKFDYLRRYAWPIGILAMIGTVVSAGLIALAARTLLNFGWESALLLGVILSPTDPVSVLSLFKQHGAPKGLQMILEGESVFNDGIGIVFYVILLKALSGEEVTAISGSLEFLKIVLGGAAVGLAVGYLAHIVISQIDDHLTEILISLVCAYGSFVLAETFHFSGVISTVLAGLLMGNLALRHAMSESTRESLLLTWEVLAFMSNSAVFLLIGLSVNIGNLLGSMGLILAAVAFMLLSRIAVIYLLLPAANLLQSAQNKVPIAWMHAAYWGGLRGAIPVALVLGLETQFQAVQNTTLSTIVFGVTVFSIVVQGITMQPLMVRLGLSSDAVEPAAH
jgi:monovalent cation:H+ antiporter, CPA1 family